MFQRLLAAFLFAATVSGSAQTSGASFSTFLKANSTIAKVATDAAGNIYVLGSAGLGRQGYSTVFVEKLNPSASEVVYTVSFGGVGYTEGGAMVVDAAGNVYLAGTTSAPDFVTVPTAPVPVISAGEGPQLPFAARVDSNGAIVYSVLFSNGVSASATAIAVDAKGGAVVSGNINTGTTSGKGFPATAGAYNNTSIINPPYVTKLDSSGTRIIFSSVGVGGSALAFDGAGDIVIAGTTGPYSYTAQYPTTTGAYQTSYTAVNLCVFPCKSTDFAGEQYVSKLSADGSNLLYSTFVSGSQGATNYGMAVDAGGNIWLTGKTASADYPYTSGQAGSYSFTTELDPTLSSVMLSVPLGGFSISLDEQGNPIEAGMFSPASTGQTAPFYVPPPGLLTNVPVQCLPTSSGSYLMQLSGKDGSLLASQLLPVGTQGSASTSSIDAAGNVYVGGFASLPDASLTPGVVYDPAIRFQPTVDGVWLTRVNLSTATPSPLACAINATSPAFAGPVAPGMLIGLIGTGPGPNTPVMGLGNGQPQVPTSLGGVTVSFDGQNAPILYASSTQVNVQVPFEVGDREQTMMTVSYNGTALASRLFAVTAENPSLFISSVTTGSLCGNGIQAQLTILIAQALNQDGTFNSCTNPAKAGSQFTVFVNGIGLAAGQQATGAYTGSNVRSLGIPAALYNNGLSMEVDSATDQQAGITGVGQIVGRVPSTVGASGVLNLSVGLGDVISVPTLGQVEIFVAQ